MKRTLAELMQERGLTVVTLARRAGVTHVAISLIVRGKRAPNIRTARKIADALGVGVDDIEFPAELQGTAREQPAQPGAGDKESQEGGMAA